MMNRIIPLLFALLLGPSLKAQVVQLKEPIRFLALGDSYTIGESVNFNERWPFQLRDSLAARGFQVDTARIIATTGWTTTNLLNAVSGQQLEGDDFNLVSLLIGVNNQFQGLSLNEYRGQFVQLMDSCLRYTGQDTSGVFVVSIPDYAFTPFGQNSGNAATISAEIDLFNAVNDSIANAYGVQYFNITPISREGNTTPSLVALDGLHPSGSQYTRWVELMLEHLDSVNITGVNEQAIAQRLKIYPVPASKNIFVSGVSTSKAVEWKIFSNSGQLMKSGKSRTVQPLKIPVSTLSPGAYLLEIAIEHQQPEVLRFMVE